MKIINWHLLLAEVPHSSKDEFREYVLASNNPNHISEDSFNTNLLQKYLMLAKKINPVVVKQIIRVGINVNHTDVWGMSALHYAAQKRAPLSTFKMLIRAGANVNQKN